MGNAAQAFKDFWQRPFDANGSAVRWFLFFGLLIVIAMAWGQIIRFIEEGV